MAGKVIDFDAWRRERDAKLGKDVEPTIFVIGGKEYVMPLEPPATVALDIIRLKETKGDDAMVPFTSINRIGIAMFGSEETWKQILDENNVGASEMADLVLQAFAAWGDIEIEEGEARPNRETRRAKPSTSSKTGRSSKPTSRGNIRSI